MKKIPLNDTDVKILSMALNNNNSVQNHYSKEIFNCHNLPDLIQHLRRKLKAYFKTDGKNILYTEYNNIIKSDGKKARIGIYRINPKFRNWIKEIINPILNNEMHWNN